MNGFAILKGLSITFRHFVETYLEDIKGGKKRYRTKEGIASRSLASTKGLFTVQYPEEKLPVPEEFRYIPFLVYDDLEDGTRDIRCTACGICAKVCPPQCIWIVRATNPETGKPVTKPEAFYIDIDLCMNCGFCAEYCPFDSIKMDHDYELATRDRFKNHIYDINKLAKSANYYSTIRPTNAAQEDEARAAKARAKAGGGESAAE
jgi:NADH-quinone oxidoreductase subunit I